MFSRIMTSILLTLTHLSCLADGGSMVIGGANQHRYEQGSAWYLGEQPIRVCAEIDKKFPFKKEEVLNIFETTFKQWAQYTVKRNVEDWSRGDRPIGAKFITKKILIQKSCAKDTELKLLLGFDSKKEVVKDSKTLFRPISFAARKSFNIHEGRGTGYIWVSSENKFWKETARANDGLYGILLHELGHVFGVPHVSGTIMSDKFISHLLQYPRTDFYFDQAKKIDHYRGLIGATTDHGLFDTNPKRIKETFKFITGREVVGQAYCNIGPSEDGKKYFFSVWDSVGKVQFEVNAAWEKYDAGFLEVNSPTVFKTYHSPQGSRDNDWKYFNDRRVSPTTNELVFKDVQGKEFKVMSINNAAIRAALRSHNDDNKDPKYASFPLQLFVLKGREFARICGPSYYFLRIQDYW